MAKRIEDPPREENDDCWAIHCEDKELRFARAAEAIASKNEREGKKSECVCLLGRFLRLTGNGEKERDRRLISFSCTPKLVIGEVVIGQWTYGCTKQCLICLSCIYQFANEKFKMTI